MKNLPNYLTIANLICGCIAIAYILNAQPYLTADAEEQYWVVGVEQMQKGALFIVLAAIFDVFDGLVARALNLTSPIGADLDSLSDVVSFGVAPAMILYKLLWAAYMQRPYAIDTPIWVLIPAFLFAACAAWRLARYNVNKAAFDGLHFTGMPVPAAGLFIASLPWINFYNPLGMGSYFQNMWTIYLIIALFSYLMVSKIPFIKLIPNQFKVKTAAPQFVLVIASLAAFLVLRIGAIPIIFLVYLLLSLFSKREPKEMESE